MNIRIARRLAQLRREHGFSQEELANRLGLSRQAVSKWERAESAPDMGNLIALAALYKITIDELLCVDTTTKQNDLAETHGQISSIEANERRGSATHSKGTANETAVTLPAPSEAPFILKDPLERFPYPLFCTAIFLVIGFCFSWWHPGWVIFLTIPFYYWIMHVLKADPGYQAWHDAHLSLAPSHRPVFFIGGKQ